MTFIIRYEVAVNSETHEDEIVMLANSRDQASEHILQLLQEKYGEQAVLLSLDISREGQEIQHLVQEWNRVRAEADSDDNHAKRYLETIEHKIKDAGYQLVEDEDGTAHVRSRGEQD